MYSHLSDKCEGTLTDSEKFHPQQKKIPPPCLLISLLKCLILLQTFLTYSAPHLVHIPYSHEY